MVSQRYIDISLIEAEIASYKKKEEQLNAEIDSLRIRRETLESILKKSDAAKNYTQNTIFTFHFPDEESTDSDASNIGKSKLAALRSIIPGIFPKTGETLSMDQIHAKVTDLYPDIKISDGGFRGVVAELASNGVLERVNRGTYRLAIKEQKDDTTI